MFAESRRGNGRPNAYRAVTRDGDPPVELDPTRQSGLRASTRNSPSGEDFEGSKGVQAVLIGPEVSRSRSAAINPRGSFGPDVWRGTYSREMPQAEVNGITLEYDISGAGEPLLLVHGLSAQLIEWPDEFVDRFVAEGYKVIRFDNRDIGLSTQDTWTPPTSLKSVGAMLARRPLKGVGYTVVDMADDAAGLLDALGIESAHVVGVSMGGMIVQELAINHPTRVRSICSIMSNVGDRKSGGIAVSLMKKVLRRPAPTRDNAVDQDVKLYGWISGPHFDADERRVRAAAAVDRSFTPQGVDRQTAAIAGSRDRTDLLGAVTAPTLVIHGLVDPLVKPSGGIATAMAIPGSRLVAFPDMGHDLPGPRLHEICDAILTNIGRTS
jgi:pimeloyl-ACP methyl ester carboxylesterase